MRQTVMQERQEKSVYVWQPAGPGAQIWLLELQPHTWILFRWWQSPRNVGVPLLGRDSFQEIDIAGVTMPITKHNYIVKDVNNLADTIRKAFDIAKERKTGSGLGIDIQRCYCNKAEYYSTGTS